MSALTMNNNVKQFPFDILKSGWGEGTLLVLFIYLKQSDLPLVIIHPGSASHHSFTILDFFVIILQWILKFLLLTGSRMYDLFDLGTTNL